MPNVLLPALGRGGEVSDEPLELFDREGHAVALRVGCGGLALSRRPERGWASGGMIQMCGWASTRIPFTLRCNTKSIDLVEFTRRNGGSAPVGKVLRVIAANPAASCGVGAVSVFAGSPREFGCLSVAGGPALSQPVGGCPQWTPT